MESSGSGKLEGNRTFSNRCLSARALLAPMQSRLDSRCATAQSLAASGNKVIVQYRDRARSGVATDHVLRKNGDMSEANLPASDPWGETLKRLGPAGRIRAAQRLYFTARRLKEAAIRAKHVTWTDAEVKKALDEAFWNARD